jgi:hypothetical protein
MGDDLKLSINPPVLSSERDAMPGYVTLGEDIETGERVYIGDIKRRSGMYALGESGEGKTTFLINIALQDIKNGHGVLFLDPHGDAIDDILARLPPERKDNVILIDPKDKTHSIGINLLRCTDPTDPLELDETCGRILSAFAKVWGNENGELGLWLEKILRNSIYLLLENPEYTLVEIPLLLQEDVSFRNFLLQNVKVKLGVKEFWFNEFDRLSKHDKTVQVGPTLSRLGSFRDITILSHIFGQKEPKIDFHNILNSKGETQNIVLLRFPLDIDSTVKKLIGTILISELLQAARNRPRENRRQFCLFVDEVQNFTSHEDFSTLFTEARKYGIATTIAHQERYGQLSDSKKLQGATDQAGTKVFFQLSVKDSKEQALTFTKEPPQEAFAISRQPFDDLLRGGHTNPDIQSFTDRYLRPLQYRLEDIKDEMEGERLLRQYFIDIAALYRVYERIAVFKERHSFDPGKYIDAQYNALVVQQNALLDAVYQSEILMSKQRGYTQLRLHLRSLNDFFTSLMEGRLKPGHEEFGLFIASFVCASSFALVPFKYVKLLTLYVLLKYGDPSAKRTIPFAFAQAHGVFQNKVSLLTHQAMEKTRNARQEFQENFIKKEWDRYIHNRQYKVLRRNQELERIRALGFQAEYSDKNKYEELLEECVDVSSLEHRRNENHPLVRMWPRQIFGFYYSSIDHYSVGEEERLIGYIHNIYINYVWLLSYPEILDILSPYSTAQFTPKFEEVESFINKLIVEINKHFDEPDYGDRSYDWWLDRGGRFMKESVIIKLVKFLLKYKESALVMFSLLTAAHKCEFHHGLVGLEPIEVLRVVKKLNEFMLLHANSDVFLKYFEELRLFSYFERLTSPSLWRIWGADKDKFREELREAGFGFSVSKLKFDVEKRKAVKFLKTTLTDRWDRFSKQYPTAASLWLRSDELTQWYLLNRACDLVYYGEPYANRICPQPSFSGAEGLVASLVWLLKDEEARLVEAKQRGIDENERIKDAEKRKEIEKECAEKMAKISIAPLENLDPVVLSESEIKSLIEACQREFDQANQREWDVKATLKVIDEFVEFCKLLPKPENLLKTRTAQLVTHRTYNDMEAEASWKLSRLSPYTALVQNGKQGGVKIKTEELPKLRLQGKELEEFISQTKEYIKQNMIRLNYVKKRSDIEKEINQRQQMWRSKVQVATHTSAPSEEPPPTYY